MRTVKSALSRFLSAGETFIAYSRSTLIATLSGSVTLGLSGSGLLWSFCGIDGLTDSLRSAIRASRFGLTGIMKAPHYPEFLQWMVEMRVQTTTLLVDRIGGSVVDIGERLAGKRILIVEDDYLEAQDMAQALRGALAIVVGPVPTVSAALGLLDTEAIHGAVLSINLADGHSDAVCQRLVVSNIPFIVVSGFGRDSLPQAFRSAPYLEKPFERSALIAALAMAI